MCLGERGNKRNISTVCTVVFIRVKRSVQSRLVPLSLFVYVLSVDIPVSVPLPTRAYGCAIPPPVRSLTRHNGNERRSLENMSSEHGRGTSCTHVCGCGSIITATRHDDETSRIPWNVLPGWNFCCGRYVKKGHAKFRVLLLLLYVAFAEVHGRT